MAPLSPSGRKPDPTLLESWDEKLIREGIRILSNRRRYVEEIRKELAHDFWSHETLEIQYASTIPVEGNGMDEIEAGFRRRLDRGAEHGWKERLYVRRTAP